MLTTKPGGDGRISPPGLSVLAGPHKGRVAGSGQPSLSRPGPAVWT